MKLKFDEKFFGKADRVVEQIENRSLIFILCENRPATIYGYVGFYRAGHVLMLLDKKVSENIKGFQRLLMAYHPSYVYYPDGSMWDTGLTIDYKMDDNLALLLSTSGSTGSSKFVRLSYGNVRSNANAIQQYLKINEYDCAITTMPMNYAYGLSIINSHLVAGASIVPTELSVLQKEFWEITKNEGVNNFGGVPYIYEMISRLGLERLDLSGIRYLTQAGGKLSPLLAQELTEGSQRRSIKFYIMYGQTEATARMSYVHWESAYWKYDSIGKPIPGGKFSLAEEDGEIIYEGPNVCMGYAKDRFDLARGDENNGILYTGDIGRIDKHGFYYVVGRKSRFVKVRGVRVGLDDLEWSLMEQGIECACVGNDDDLKIYVTNMKDVERAGAYIKSNTDVDIKCCRIFLIGRIPRSDPGKILYKELENRDV